MPLTAGTRLGPYEVLDPLGAGGMGEVYCARDTKLDRAVAIKILPEAFAHDPERLGRFEREAKTLAALNHPNIAIIHGFEEANGIKALVMELVEGPTLADRIAHGPIPLDDALPIARQIVEALQAAHEQGIVHRDLKPANIKLRPDGTVKVLDFGLAKALDAAPDAGSMSISPTLTSPVATRVGMLLGTAPYMSPEQARGRPADRRADIFAFGCVLYEMVTGSRLFKGEDVTETIAAVVKEQPDLNNVPAEVRRLLKACLEKDPKRRLQAIGDVWLLLDEDAGASRAVARSDLRYSRLAWAATAASLLLAAGVSVVHFQERPLVRELVRFPISPPDGVTMSGGEAPVVSPDGRRVVFVAESGDSVRRLWVRSLDALESQPLAGTDGALRPFWSPDSRSIGFFAGGRVRKVEATGGPVQTVVEPGALSGSGGRDGAWSTGGLIVFAGRDGGLVRVSDSGGAPTALTILDRERSELLHRSPIFLPDGIHFLYGRASTVAENHGIYIGSLEAAPEDQQSRRVLGVDGDVTYAPVFGETTGHVLFVRERTLMAQPFDHSRLELTGPPVPVTQAGEAGEEFFSASQNGVLVYRPNRAGGDSELTWFNRDGKRLSTALKPGLVDVAISPDASRVAGSSSDRSLAAFRASEILARGGRRITGSRGPTGSGGPIGGDLWLGEFERGTSIRFTTNDAWDGVPVWSPDGRRIVFASNRNDTIDLYQKAGSAAGSEEVLLTSDESKLPSDWSPDGLSLLYSSSDPKTGDDLWVLPLSSNGTPSGQPRPYLRTDFDERGGRFSPDGRWIAYSSNATGQVEVYVQPFPASTGPIRISTGGGRESRWRRDGRELFYLGPRGQVMVVEVATSPTFTVSRAPRRLFDAPIYGGPARSGSFDVTGDGQRFLINTSPGAIPAPGSVTVVLNWYEELKQRTPSR